MSRFLSRYTASRRQIAFNRYFYQYLTIAHERPGESRSQGSRERATAKGRDIQTGRHKKPYRASCRMFLHLEIGSSKPIEVKTKTRGLEKGGKERGKGFSRINRQNKKINKGLGNKSR